ncbi:hypothetical protein DSLASN_03280 [Desulfoluna limicola]|uniref:Methyltransferase type 12 n=1 Tax=Desulfoluna limicola TaxID=2810562 RepID=A0ABM7PBY2_9BACT|nr:class I SAM-dependent methyltransferase [Desulfoluna limicola]BCS94696.1 hypothetical protein DSLASN_03280 [Desulfoluna limicola]
MFNKFPKTRPRLPSEIEAIYLTYYKSNREGQTSASSLAQKMESWLHNQVAKDLADEQGMSKATLELGAGTLNQLQYEPVVGHYDIVEPFKGLYINSSRLERVRNVYSDISNIPEKYRYDRITSIATLEHVCNLPEVIARCGLLLSKNGVVRASIPSEGTFLWAMGWRLTTGIEFKLKYGLDYGLVMRHEHVNSAYEIEAVLNFFFEKVECKVFGISKAISLYRFYTCSRPIIEECQKYVSQKSI